MIWIMLAIVQAICFLLSNGKFHPLAKILEGCDISAGKDTSHNVVPLNFNLSITFSDNLEDIKKVVNCPMNDKTVPIKFWPQNQKMGAIVRRHSCIF